ncbi:flocculation-associated PEP-CTERM protein PepA [Methylicorpusculum sp.]|uniref:flocculation-associated PEP-CTERM protein PepA n=1 Tax=Methylicorpusculum sp. TaxID=2713644 RepID=UPI00272C5681|nr:flocculation-associated PEP-CTERM protein PepA [Methylicorpusculum sp.]
MALNKKTFIPLEKTMKLLTTKNLAAATLTAAMGMASTSAMAFPLFTVDESSVEGNVNTVIADRITGGYTEVVTFEAVTAATGNFFTSIIFNAGQFFNGANSQGTLLNNIFGTIGYALYATFLGEGTYVTNADLTTDFVFTGGTFDLFVDPDRDTTFAGPADGKTAYGVTPGVADLKVGSGSIIFGNGTLDPTSATCINGVNCGSFGTNTDFQLTAFGATYFVDPIPFYNLTFESGQFLNFTVAGTQTISGSMDVVFGTKSVPEPTTVALMGLGLLGLGLRRRKA